MPNEQNIEIEIPILLPEIEDEQDQCVGILERRLQSHKGIRRVHLDCDRTPCRLCIHYDPGQISLAAVSRMAHAAGAELTDRFRHEAIPFNGIDTADAAFVIEDELSKLPGMLHARVNYAAGLVFVAYDGRETGRAEVESTLRSLGARPLSTEAPAVTGRTRAKEEHPHGVGPGFLPQWLKRRWALMLLVLSGFAIAVGWLGSHFLGLPENYALALYILAYFTGGYEIATHALPGLARGKFDTDVLMLAAALGAAVLGEWAEGAFLLFLFSLGHAGEHYALNRARQAINALGELMPQTARVLQAGRVTEIPVEDVQIGDTVIIRPGDRLPVDGEVISGESAVDQSPITGESVPVAKGPGDDVFAGTVNGEAGLKVRVTHLTGDSTLSRVIEMVTEAQSQQSPTQRFTERFSSRFVPAVLGATLLLVIVPPLVGWLTLEESFYRAMLLLVAASPCALALGAPAAVLAGIAQAARNGVLIKGGAHLENLGALSAIAFDKTGTLTQGRFALTDVIPLNGLNPDELLGLAAAVEQHANHPLAQAVVLAAEHRGLPLPDVSGLENLPGRGVRSQVDDQEVVVGSLQLMRESAAAGVVDPIHETIYSFEQQGKTTILVQREGLFLGVLAMADEPRPGVSAALSALKDLGVRTLVMLTGDNQQVADRIAEQVGVNQVAAGLLPGHKLEAIRRLQDEHGGVAMVGDGVNDAPALATATVGIAMGGAGAAVALETADVALMADDIGRLPFAVGLSRFSRSIIRQNLGIALGVIGLLIVTSVFGWIELSGAVILHEGSTILVVLNALRLLGYKE